jgi:hypothetical protein
MGRTGARTAARALALVAVLACVTSGCSGGEAGAGPTSEPSTSSSPTADPTPTGPPPPEPVDPCSLLDADDLAAAGVKADTEASVRSLVPDPRTTTCLVPHPKEGWGIYYGFHTRPGVNVAEAVEQVGTEKPVRLDAGDDARMALYAAYGDRVWHAWASQGRHAVMLQLFEKPRPADVEALLTAMLDQVDPDMFRFPIDLPPGCPKPKEKAITALVGDVVTATGSELEDDVRCDYANRRGLTLNVAGSPMKSAAEVRSSISQVEEYFTETLTPTRGTTVLVSPGEGYAYTSAYVEKPPTYLSTGLQVQTDIGGYFRPLSYDRDAFRALAVWWSRHRF